MGLGWGTDQKIVSDDLIFYLSPTFAIFPHVSKNTRLKYIYFKKEFFPIRSKFQSKMDKRSLKFTAGNYVWLSSVIYNDHL